MKERKFLLKNEQGKSLALTPDEVAKLVLNARAIFRQLMSKDSPQNQYIPIPTIGVLRARVVVDAHHTSAVLMLTREDGEEEGFVLPAESMKSIRDDLTKIIEEMDAHVKARVHQ